MHFFTCTGLSMISYITSDLNLPFLYSHLCDMVYVQNVFLYPQLLFPWFIIGIKDIFECLMMVLNYRAAEY